MKTTCRILTHNREYCPIVSKLYQQNYVIQQAFIKTHFVSNKIGVKDKEMAFV